MDEYDAVLVALVASVPCSGRFFLPGGKKLPLIEFYGSGYQLSVESNVVW